MKNMKYTIIIFIVLVTIIINGCKKTNNVDGPWLECKQSVYDFGKVSNYKMLEHTFLLYNNGNMPVEVNDIHSSCSCNVKQLENETIQPGKTTRLVTSMDTTGKKGLVESKYIVKTNDPNGQSIELTLKADVQEYVDIKPGSVYFGRIISDEQSEASFMISSLDNNKIDIVKAKTTSKKIKTKIEAINEGSDYKISLQTIPPLDEGVFKDTIQIETNNSKYNNIQIPVSGIVIGDLFISPPKISMVYDGQDGVYTTRSIEISPGKIKNFKILHTDIPDQSIKVEYQSLDTGGYLVWLKDIPVSKEIDGKEFFIYTDIPAYEKIKIPIIIK